MPITIIISIPLLAYYHFDFTTNVEDCTSLYTENLLDTRE